MLGPILYLIFLYAVFWGLYWLFSKFSSPVLATMVAISIVAVIVITANASPSRSTAQIYADMGTRLAWTMAGLSVLAALFSSCLCRIVRRFSSVDATEEADTLYYCMGGAGPILFVAFANIVLRFTWGG